LGLSGRDNGRHRQNQKRDCKGAFSNIRMVSPKRMRGVQERIGTKFISVAASVAGKSVLPSDL
jgi:hypothetical protein